MMVRLVARCVLVILLSAAGCFEDPAGPPATGAQTTTEATTTSTSTSTEATTTAQTSATTDDATTLAGSSSSSTESTGTTTTTSDGSDSTSSSGTDADSSTTRTDPFTHVLFVTQERFAGGQIGSLEAADALCVAASPDGGPHMAILSDSTTMPADRVEILGPVFNTAGQQVAADAETLWSGTAQADVGFDEDGNPIPDANLAWIGSAEASCEDWTTEVFEELGAFSVPTNPAQWLLPEGTFQCGLELHIYCISVG